MTETRNENASGVGGSKKMTVEELEAMADTKKIQAERKKKLKAKRRGEDLELSITSLLDIMTILLVFMLMNFATNPMNINPTGDMNLVKSTELHQTHEQMTALAITQNHILVEDKPVVQIKQGKVSSRAKRDGEDGFVITPLFDALKTAADHQKRISRGNEAVKFKGRLLVIGDENVPYRLLSEILYTAGQAEYGEFEFAVIRM